MKSLLYSVEILAVFLFIQGFLCQNSESPSEQTSVVAVTTPTTHMIASVKTTKETTLTPGVSTEKSPLPPPSPTPDSTKTYICSFWPFTIQKECCMVLVVCCGLIIACTIFLTTTLILTWKVCQMSRRLKRLGNNSDNVSTSGYWVNEDKKNNSMSETAVKETALLMSDVSQTNQELENDAVKKDGGKVDEDGQKTEEKEVGDAPKSEEVSPPEPDADTSAFPEPPEEVNGSETTPEPTASSHPPSEGEGEPKNQP